ncbi:MAG: acyl-CoA thioesterase [Firmicutes bacterium]|nr:acyl-CoA thioesterase [Bacillota bacterium]
MLERQVEPYTRRVYYYETDNMGIVHHSNYIRIMEETRLDFMHKAGMDYAEMERMGVIMPIVDVFCKYIYSARYDEELVGCIQLTEFNGVRAAFKYEIYTLGGKELAASGESHHCFLDVNTRIPVNLKKRCPEFYANGMAILKGAEKE